MNLAELPNRRVEAWKYSDLRAAAGGALPPARPSSPERESLAAFAREKGDVIGMLAAAHGRAERQNIVGKHEAVVGGRVDGFGARLEVLNVVRNAELTRVIIQNGDDIDLLSTHVRLAEGAKFRQFIISEGAKLARIETRVSIEGEGAEVELNGVYMCGERRHADFTSVVEHKAPGGTTRQLVKGVAAKGGRGVFQGKIVVAPHAQKTDARQYHHGMLLEDGAEIYAKPELMIHADDVQCAHGNTAGGLDERALFYMRARGVPEAEARALLIEAFLVEAIPDGLDAAIRDELTGRIGAWLRGARP